MYHSIESYGFVGISSNFLDSFEAYSQTEKYDRGQFQSRYNAIILLDFLTHFEITLSSRKDYLLFSKVHNVSLLQKLSREYVV